MILLLFQLLPTKRVFSSLTPILSSSFRRALLVVGFRQSQSRSLPEIARNINDRTTVPTVPAPLQWSSSGLVVMSAFYAVAAGRKVGVYNSWEECQEQVQAFKGAKYKKFPTLALANEFLSAAGQGKIDDVVAGSMDDEAKKTVGRPPTTGASAPSSKRLLDPSTSLSSSQTVRELHSLRKTVDDLSSSIKEFVETKGKELSAVKRKIEDLLGASTDAVEQEDDIGSSRKRLKTEAFSGNAEKGRLMEDGFIVDENGFVHVYTDGACEGNGYSGARGGIGVWWNHDHKLNIAAPLSSNQRHTNNVAEIQAAIEAIRMAKASNISKLLVNTDSKFMIDCMTKWIIGWRRNGWKTATKEPVKNKDELVVLDGLLNEDRGFQIHWNHVRGHAGVEGNERADELARRGAKL